MSNLTEDRYNTLYALGITVQELIDQLNGIENKQAIVFALSNGRDDTIFQLGPPMISKIHYNGYRMKVYSFDPDNETVHDGVIL